MNTEWVTLELRLPAKDAGTPVSLPDGMEIQTLEEFGDTPENRHRVFELDRSCSADLPEHRSFPSFEEYEELRFAGPGYRPDGVVLLLDSGDPVGLCVVSGDSDERLAHLGTQGVLRPYRHRGFGTLLKQEAIRRASAWGKRRLRTLHHPMHTAIIEKNIRLGFKPVDRP